VDQEALVDGPDLRSSLCVCGIAHPGAELRDRAIYLHALLAIRFFSLTRGICVLQKLWEGWKRIARRIGDFQARVLLTIIYAILVLPFGLAVRLFCDPLRIKHVPNSWLDRPGEPSDITWARKQS
jgi:hypothetical protein